ncbi:hypothetical protein BaRGS_00015332 [Batillaria attramentaria]|uniref:Uncharacterized protein n=1 Tax=Batillaria attramentaria TaxID=370345 RepID=A0ABD0L215_9CAEN
MLIESTKTTKIAASSSTDFSREVVKNDREVMKNDCEVVKNDREVVKNKRCSNAHRVHKHVEDTSITDPAPISPVK